MHTLVSWVTLWKTSLKTEHGCCVLFSTNPERRSQQHTKLYVHLHPISQTILESQQRHVFFKTACCFEQILKEAANNTPTVRQLISYLTNDPGKSTKTCFFLTQRAVLNKSWKKQPTTHQLYVHLHPISQTILESQRTHVFFNTACCFKQILEEAANNTPTVRPLTSYLTNHPGKSTKTCFF